MRKALQYLAVALAVLCFWGAVFAFGILYQTRWKVTTVGTEVSPNGDYQVIFQMIGEPAWPFGPTRVRFLLQDRENTLEQQDTLLYNDGCALTPSCWAVQWGDTSVEITLSGEEQADAHYILPLTGLEGIP